MPNWDSLNEALRESAALVVRGNPSRVRGGDISAAWRVETDGGSVFVKTGAPSAADGFAAEADGLLGLSSSGAVRVPNVLAHGSTESDAYIALEWLELGSPGDAVAERFGRQLAALHRVSSDRHGWRRDNTIGRTPQKNAWSESWLEFFGQRRLGYQLELAGERGYDRELGAIGTQLLDALPGLLGEHEPRPSLLHGDLWAGNFAACRGEPVMFDPAVHFGDRETDLAMTHLFGGFPPRFYAAYREAWPLAAGAERRIELYQLYHVLNHLNLFGGVYVDQSLSLMRRVLAETH